MTKSSSPSRLDAFFGNPAAAVGMAVVCNVLWGSAFPFIKMGYRLFAIDATDTASIMCFAGVRFSSARCWCMPGVRRCGAGRWPNAKGQKFCFPGCGLGLVADGSTVYLLLFCRCPADRGHGRHSELHPELYGGYPGTLFVRQSRPHDAAQSYWLCAGVQRCAGGNSWQPRQRQPGGLCPIC